MSQSGQTINVERSVTRIARVKAEDWHQLSWLIRWFIMIRAPVLVMTLSSAIAGVLLALRGANVRVDLALVTVLGLTLAHATNNLLNDWIDHILGVDKGNYFRQRYGTHVLEDGLVSRSTMAAVTLLTGGAALACGVYLIFMTPMGENIAVLLVTGSVFVLFYTWPLKHLALGELSVLLVWGPLMTGGTYFVLTGHVTVEVLLLAFITGLSPTLVIFGKHIDKIEDDSRKPVNTLPVVIGRSSALLLAKTLLYGLWVLLAIAIFTFQFFGLLVCLVALRSAWRLKSVLDRPNPQQRPTGFPESIWPLWYSAYAFSFARVFGLALLVGLGLQVIIDLLY